LCYGTRCSAPRRAGRHAAKPLDFMPHEAPAVDPGTGHVYVTEDNWPNTGFDRFIPNVRQRRIGALGQGGRLEMLKVFGTHGAELRVVEQTRRAFGFDEVTGAKIAPSTLKRSHAARLLARLRDVASSAGELAEGAEKGSPH
jgi:uncharacterized protein